MVKKLQKKQRAATIIANTTTTTQQALPHQERDRRRRSTAPSPELRTQDTIESRRITYPPLPKVGEEESAKSTSKEDEEISSWVPVGEKVEQKGRDLHPLRMGEDPGTPSQNLRVFCPDCIRGTHKGQRRTEE